MRKRKIWLFIIMLALFMMTAAAAIGLARGYRYCAWEDSIDRRVTPDGTIYELLSVGDDSMALRRITWDGFVTGYYPLPSSTDDGMHMTYRVIGITSTELLLHSYESSGDTPERRKEMIVAYSLTSGNPRVVAMISPPDTLKSYDVFFARNTSRNVASIGYLETESGRMTLVKVDAASGAVKTMPDVDMPFPLSAIAEAQTGELFALSMDSRVYMLEGDAWVCLFRPEKGEAVANMTIGEKGEIFLFTVSDGGTHAMISTPKSREFVPMNLNTEDIIKLHIASEDVCVGLDTLNRYVVYIGGYRYTINTLRTQLQTLWDMEFQPVVIYSALAATVIFAIILLMVVNRRLHLLPKLLIMIVPMFTIGILALVNIAERSVRESVENGLRDSILEYAYEIAADIDAERLANIDWNAPFENEYYVELTDYLDELSGYRMMDVLNEEDVYSHNAFISCWMYRVDGGKVYTAIGGNYAIGLEMKYFVYSRDDARLSDKHNFTKPLNLHLSGAESIIRYNTILFPIIFQERLVAYLEIARPMTAVDAAVYDLRKGIVRAGMMVFAAVISTLVLVLVFSTATLSKLKRRALDVSGGDYSARVNTRAWDETGEIAAAFNKMAQSVERSVKEITNVSNGYKRFVPDRLVELLDKSSISELQPGDNKTLTATHILLYTDTFEKLRDGELFGALSRFHNTVLPCIAAADGLMTQHSPRGLAAVFKKDPETVLHAMFALFAALDRDGGAECHVFMSYSGTMLGVTGNQDRLNMIAVSRLIYESNTVGLAGKSFGTRLMVPLNMYEEMGDAAYAYNHRFLGYLSHEGEHIPLYDFFDCDKADIKVKKSMLKERFENGVALYYDRQYSKARRIFVELIKEFPEDTASREYLRLSHTGLESGGDPLPIIELQ